jgi:hypothetical protein
MPLQILINQVRIVVVVVVVTSLLVAGDGNLELERAGRGAVSGECSLSVAFSMHVAHRCVCVCVSADDAVV